MAILMILFLIPALYADLDVFKNLTDKDVLVQFFLPFTVTSILFLFMPMLAGSFFAIMEHELTHMLFAILTFHKPKGLDVKQDRGGYFSFEGNGNWLIALAPYFFPFWTVIVVLLALAVRGIIYFVNPEASFPVPWLWMFAVGFTWCFHACFTIRSLMQTQSDVQEYGRIFSWTLILACNIAGILLWIICTTDVPAIAIFKCLSSHTVAAYQQTFQSLCEWISLIRNEIRGASA